MDNIQDKNTTMPEGMMNIQRLVSALNNNPVSVAAITFDILRNVTNGFNVQHVVFLLVSITRDNLREYLRDTIFDAIRMDNELLPPEMRQAGELLENRFNEIWRQVTVKLHYAGKQKARRNSLLRTMLDESPTTSQPQENTLTPSPLQGRKLEAMPSINVVINNQSGDDKRQIALSGNDSIYNENIKE